MCNRSLAALQGLFFAPKRPTRPELPSFLPCFALSSLGEKCFSQLTVALPAQGPSVCVVVQILTYRHCVLTR